MEFLPRLEHFIFIFNNFVSNSRVCMTWKLAKLEKFSTVTSKKWKDVVKGWYKRQIMYIVSIQGWKIEWKSQLRDSQPDMFHTSTRPWMISINEPWFSGCWYPLKRFLCKNKDMKATRLWIIVAWIRVLKTWKLENSALLYKQFCPWFSLTWMTYICITLIDTKELLAVL